MEIGPLRARGPGAPRAEAACARGPVGIAHPGTQPGFCLISICPSVGLGLAGGLHLPASPTHLLLGQSQPRAAGCGLPAPSSSHRTFPFVFRRLGSPPFTAPLFITGGSRFSPQDQKCYWLRQGSGVLITSLSLRRCDKAHLGNRAHLFQSKKIEQERSLQHLPPSVLRSES